jgi:hypothetical protein
MPDDKRINEDSFVALVLILGKLLQAEDLAKSRSTIEGSITSRLRKNPNSQWIS